MGRTTKSLSGGGKDKLLKALIGSEAEIAHAPAERLFKHMSDIITEVRVKRDAWEEIGKDMPKGLGKRSAAALAAKQVPNHASAPAAAFDPFAFSALAVLTKKGKPALNDALAGIGTAEHLHALAAAQHLAIDRSEMDVVKLRAAIVTATETRLKERRAAAS